MARCVVVRLLIVLSLALAPAPLFAQTEVDLAIRFFAQGGAYCFRIAPEGTNLSEETEWTVMVLTNTENRKRDFRIRSVDPGPMNIKGQALNDVGLSITMIWRRDLLRDDFFERFAAGIDGRSLRARTVQVVPPGLSTMKPRERAELYLKFGDRGTRVNFEHARELTDDEFAAYRTYLTD